MLQTKHKPARTCYNNLFDYATRTPFLFRRNSVPSPSSPLRNSHVRSGLFALPWLLETSEWLSDDQKKGGDKFIVLESLKRKSCMVSHNSIIRRKQPPNSISATARLRKPLSGVQSGGKGPSRKTRGNKQFENKYIHKFFTIYLKMNFFFCLNILYQETNKKICNLKPGPPFKLKLKPSVLDSSKSK